MENLLNQIGMPLIAVLVPIVVFGIKRALPKVPKWALPMLAAILGPAIDQGIAWAASVEAHGILAIALGLAGVGLREIGNQGGKAIKDSMSGPTLSSFALPAAVAALLLLGGCPAPGTVNESPPEVVAVQKVTKACATYDATLRSLAVMRGAGHLSETEIAIVNQWRPIMWGICTGDVPDTAAESLLDTAEKALFELSKIERSQ